MKPNTYVILQRAVEEGALLGYRRAFKHNEDPSEEIICETIEECVMSQIYEYFDFSDTDG